MNNITIKIVVINVMILTANKLKKLSKVNSIKLIFTDIVTYKGCSKYPSAAATATFVLAAKMVLAISNI